MGDTRREPIARARPRLHQHDIRERNWKICLYYDTAGTGRYAGIRSLPLQFNAKHSKTGKKEAISFRGTATLPR